MKRCVFSLLLIFYGWRSIIWGQTQTPTPPVASADSFQDEKKRLELERLQLENEKLKLEMEKQKLENEKAKNQKEGQTSEEKAQVAAALIAEVSKKAEALAKENKDNPDIVVVDFINSEIWNKGVRYSIHELYDLAEDNHWPMKKVIAQKSSAGDPRFLYRVRNLSLLKYSANKRGILTLEPPSKPDDFKMLTPEGATLAASIGDVRTAYQSVYFIYEGESKEDNLKILKYLHKVELNFSDRLEYSFDKSGKLVKIRYGVLDEH